MRTVAWFWASKLWRGTAKTWSPATGKLIRISGSANWQGDKVVQVTVTCTSMPGVPPRHGPPAAPSSSPQPMQKPKRTRSASHPRPMTTLYFIYLRLSGYPRGDVESDPLPRRQEDRPRRDGGDLPCAAARRRGLQEACRPQADP